ncbi:amidohydrolase [Tenuifilum thalassicum]|uniref:Amidohydrolase n=1 Tax=Tenuifilum thalassicum TaxID=2590900 RepID=A0A7D3XHW8_9BACT|nr:amidohydrolase [Tenuifilum thalassicum]QKG80817.1 amidohydrolase [Tenuifilum thalassicum]
MPLPTSLLSDLITLRQYLHKHPELSGFESATSQKVAELLAETNPTEIIENIGGYGVAAVFDSGHNGPTVLFRADMDALPIEESNLFAYRSSNRGIAHLCGHDGHTSILVGLAKILSVNPPKRGKVVLLFQPAEETGEGASKVISDPKFKRIKPDYAFGLHNLPGFEKGTIYTRVGTFASASTGMIVELKGLSSHAAHPEDGNNPDRAMANIILGFNKIASEKAGFKDFVLLTVIHAKLGEVAFGTTPGKATVMATLRSFENGDMQLLKQKAESVVNSICSEYNLKHTITYQEEFPATINHPESNEIVKDACNKLVLKHHSLSLPFRWSEDFGHFSNICNTAFFGVGAGINHPQLHNEDYDFPDEIIEPSILVFEQVLSQLLNG